MSDRAAEYRARLDELRRQGGGRWRTPPGLRDEIVGWARKQQAAGRGLGTIALAIGLGESTLGKWLAPADGAGELRPVRVSADAAVIRSSLVVVTPEGYRLEGLSLEEAVDVLRRL